MLSDFPLYVWLACFAGAALVIGIAGIRMAGLADRLADRTGWGEAVMGGIVLGMTTSLSGMVVSLTSALDGRASLAFANGVGGIAAQTAFLAVADLVYRRANLEHASAEVTSLFQSALLVLMMSIPLVAYSAPEVTLFGVHPCSVILVGAYLIGARHLSIVRKAPMWRPIATPETREDLPEESDSGMRRSYGLILQFGCLAVLIAGAGWVVAVSGARISDVTGISQTAIGALLTAVATSLPELVTTVAAVRRGATQLALGGIIGGNCFDLLFLSVSDAAYRGGSLYHALTPGDLFWLSIGIAMTGLLLLGLIVRERRGVAGIGFESAGILALYAGAVAVQAWIG